jgi:hypothetical protein
MGEVDVWWQALLALHQVVQHHVVGVLEGLVHAHQHPLSRVDIPFDEEVAFGAVLGPPTRIELVTYSLRVNRSTD